MFQGLLNFFPFPFAVHPSQDSQALEAWPNLQGGRLAYALWFWRDCLRGQHSLPRYNTSHSVHSAPPCLRCTHPFRKFLLANFRTAFRSYWIWIQWSSLQKLLKEALERTCVVSAGWCRCRNWVCLWQYRQICKCHESWEFAKMPCFHSLRLLPAVWACASLDLVDSREENRALEKKHMSIETTRATTYSRVSDGHMKWTYSHAKSLYPTSEHRGPKLGSGGWGQRVRSKN